MIDIFKERVWQNKFPSSKRKNLGGRQRLGAVRCGNVGLKLQLHHSAFCSQQSVKGIQCGKDVKKSHAKKANYTVGDFTSLGPSLGTHRLPSSYSKSGRRSEVAHGRNTSGKPIRQPHRPLRIAVCKACVSQPGLFLRLVSEVNHAFLTSKQIHVTCWTLSICDWRAGLYPVETYSFVPAKWQIQTGKSISGLITNKCRQVFSFQNQHNTKRCWKAL